MKTHSLESLQRELREYAYGKPQCGRQACVDYGKCECGYAGTTSYQSRPEPDAHLGATEG